MVPALIVLLTELVWAPKADSETELFLGAGIANRTLFVSSLISLIAAVVRLHRTGVSFYAWVAAVLYTATHLSLLLMMGFMTWEKGPQAVGILSIVIGWVMGSGFEKMAKPRFARPFHWLGSLALVVGLLLLAQVPLLKWIGVDFLAFSTTKGWSLAISGFILLLVSYALEKSIRLERRRIAHYLEWICPFFILGGFYQAAQSQNPVLEWDSASSIWITVAPFMAAVLMFVGLTAKSWRPRFMLSAMAGIALSIHLLAHHELLPIRPLMMMASFGGLLFATAFYIRMEITPVSRDKKRPLPPPISED